MCRLFPVCLLLTFFCILSSLSRAADDPATNPAAAAVPPALPTQTTSSDNKILYEKNIKLVGAEKSELTVFVQLPPGTKSGSEVKGVLAYLTWNTDPNLIRNLLTGGHQKTAVIGDMTGLQRINAQYSDIAFKHHLALATWTTYWSTKAFDRTSYDQMSVEERRQFDDKFDHVAEQWRLGVNELIKEQKLPANQWLLYGMSGGAQWAHRIALRQPDLFAAVHIHINSSYDKPTAAASKILWLVTTGELEKGYPDAKQFYTDSRALGYEMIFDAMPKVAHDDTPAVDALSTTFFEYAIQRILPGPATSPAQKPAFIGNYSTHEFVPAGREASIPVNLRVALPTAALAKAWGQPAE